MSQARARRLMFGLVVMMIAGLVLTDGAPGRAAGDAGDRLITVQILAMNDFHGGIEQRTVANRPAGGAAALAAHLAERRAAAAHSITVHAGDMIGASPPLSNLLRDEPAIEVLDLLGIEFGATGNHEFDRGIAALRRLQHGGCDQDGNCFGGARMQYLAANVIDDATGAPVFPPYALRTVAGVPLGFIGVTLRETPTIVTPSGVAGLTFLDEVTTINRYVAELQARGIRTIIALVHQGGRGTLDGGPISGADIIRIATGLDGEVDLIVSGHSHQGYQGRIAGKLVTEAFANGTAFADITLQIDPATGDVAASSAEIVTAYADTITPDPAVAARVQQWSEMVRPLVERVAGAAAEPLTRDEDAAGQSTLGRLIADAMQAAMGSRIACMNPGGIRADLPAGPVTWGHLFTIQPFANDLVELTLTGAQIERLLNQQWAGQPFPRIMKCAGLIYTWHASRPEEQRVSLAEITLTDGTPLTADGRYTITVNNFMADGGDNYTALRDETDRVIGPVDLDALVEYMQARPGPLTAPRDTRIIRRE